MFVSLLGERGKQQGARQRGTAEHTTEVRVAFWNCPALRHVCANFEDLAKKTRPTPCCNRRERAVVAQHIAQLKLCALCICCADDLLPRFPVIAGWFVVPAPVITRRQLGWKLCTQVRRLGPCRAGYSKQSVSAARVPHVFASRHQLTSLLQGFVVASLGCH